jgi:hypothetical protein
VGNGWVVLLNKKVQEGRKLVQQWNSAATRPQHIIWARYSTSSTIPTQTQKDQQTRTTGWFFTKNNTEKNYLFTIAAAQLPLMNLTWILSLFYFFFCIFTRMQSRTNPSRIVNRMSVSMVQGSCTHVCDHKKFLQSVSVTITKSLQSVTRGNPCSWGFSFAERIFLGFALFVLVLGFVFFLLVRFATERLKELNKLLEDVARTAISTGPRGAIRLAQGIEAVVSVGSEYLLQLYRVFFLCSLLSSLPHHLIPFITVCVHLQWQNPPMNE